MTQCHFILINTKTKINMKERDEKMPKETFVKLSNEKKEKIVKSAKEEFARVPFSQTSIKNIVEKAGIARGSFYQYFESKEDLLEYIISTHSSNLNQNVKNIIEKNNGDIFEVYINMYDDIIERYMNQEDILIYKKIFENIKVCEEKVFFTILKKYEPKTISDYYNMIDTKNLNINSKEDLKALMNLLNLIMKKAIISNSQYNEKQEARVNFIKMINYIKYGVIKK